MRDEPLAVTDPAVEAANRAATKIMFCRLGSNLYPSDLPLAAGEALAPLKELHRRSSCVCGGIYTCAECEKSWPCPTAKLIYREDEL